jgi:hypothetical protein
MEKRVYLSLIEAEGLIFNKILFLPKSRLGIKQAQKDLSIVTLVKTEFISELESQIIIFSSSISSFEIPEKEETLFLNHFRVPKGLISTSGRLYRESKKESNEIDFFETKVLTEKDINDFTLFRRGFFNCYALAVNHKISKNFANSTIEILNNKSEFSSFKINFIKTLLSTKFYPSKERNDGKFYIEAIKRFNWWGAYLIKNCTTIDQENDDELNDIKNWLLNFKDKDNYIAIKKAASNVPDVFFEDFEFIVGYYFAATYFEEASIGINFYDFILKKLLEVKLDKNSKVVFWAIYFQSIFKDNLDFLYVIPSLRKQLWFLETKLFSILNTQFKLEDETDIFNVELISLDKEKRVAEYLQLINGGKILEPKFISKEDQKELLDNTFANNNIMKVGLVSDNSSPYKYLIQNQCGFNNKGFFLSLSSKPSEVQFYVKEQSKERDWLKELKLKVYPLNKIIEKNKKVLVGFLKQASYERSLFKIYEMIFEENSKKVVFKDIVFVLLVDEDTEVIQSPKFQLEKNKIEDYCKRKFGTNLTLLVKNENTNTDGEIKRNLKHILGNYKIKDIELINENINDSKREWILSVSNEYVVNSNFDNYYTLIN